MDFAAVRRNMVENQLRPNRVIDPAVVDAMASVPRESFLPKAMRGVAYVDEDVPLGGGRHLIEPLVLGRLLQTAEVRPDDVALVVGCPVGYAAAVLARMCSAVVALESDAAAAEAAARALAEVGADNVVVETGPLAEGWPKQAPYDVILLAGAVAEIPDSLCQQLGDGGRLVGVVRPDPLASGEAVVVARIGDSFGRRPVFDAATPVLPEFRPREQFVF